MKSRWVVSISMCVVVALVASMAMGGSVSSARGRIIFAKDSLDSGRYDDAEQKLQDAEKQLEGVSDAEKAPLVAEIAAIRKEIAAKQGGEQAARVERQIKQIIDSAEEDIPNSVGRVAGELEQATNKLNSDDAKKYLDAATVKKLQERIAQVKAKAGGSQSNAAFQNVADKIKRLEDDLSADPFKGMNERQARAEFNNFEAETRGVRDYIKHLPPEDPQTKALTERLDGVLKRAEGMSTGTQKKGVFAKIEPKLKALEDKVNADPYKGVEQGMAYRVNQDLAADVSRIKSDLFDLPKDDPQVKAVYARLDGINKKIDAAEKAWGQAQLQKRVAEAWKSIKQETEGWEQESQDTSAKGMREWKMPKSTMLVRRVAYWLEDKDTKKIREENKDDTAIQAAFAEAEKALAAAADKMNVAFNKIMDEAYKLPTPRDPYDLAQPSIMSSGVENSFAGTKYHDANIARVKGLTQKWEAEIEAKRKANEAVYAKLSDEANKAWPKIESSLKPQGGFNPSDLNAWKGKTIELKGVYNRAGWDFIDCDFSMRLNGVPISGTYSDKVGAALSAAVQKTDMSIDDHAPWDVVAVVDGPGQMRERTHITVKTEGGVEVGKLEEWRPVNCVHVKIIALRAGPVAVGP